VILVKYKFIFTAAKLQQRNPQGKSIMKRFYPFFSFARYIGGMLK
jgi:hypothetical protein